MSQKILGIIAGNGKFPIAFAKKAKQRNYRVVAAGIKGDTLFMFKYFTDVYKSFPVGELHEIFSYLRDNGVRQVIMAGQVNPNNLFEQELHLDQEFQKLFSALKDRKADTIFAALGEKLKEYDIELIDSTFLIKDHLAPKGVLTERSPTEMEQADIAFGREIAKAMGGLDIGQTVIIKDKAIVAIEAMEGTDRTILRGGNIARNGAVVVKMSKPNQDLRFDVPVIGPRTIRKMIKSNASCVAIEAGKTIIIDRQKTVNLANRASICITSL